MPDLPIVPFAAQVREWGKAQSQQRRIYTLANVEVRDSTADGGGLTLTGYASVTGFAYEIWGGPANGGWNETVVRGAFKKTLSEKPDVLLLINHDGLPLARTKPGTLRLAEDEQGLYVEADLEPTDPDVQRLLPKMQRGDVTEMSFAFMVIRQQWLNEAGEEVPWWDIAGIERHILEVSIQRGDVSVVSYGANPATSAELVARAQAEPQRFDAGQVRAAMESVPAERRAAEDPDPPPVAEDPVVDEVPVTDPEPVVGMTLAMARLLAAI